MLLHCFQLLTLQNHPPSLNPFMQRSLNLFYYINNFAQEMEQEIKCTNQLTSNKLIVLTMAVIAL